MFQFTIQVVLKCIIIISEPREVKRIVNVNSEPNANEYAAKNCYVQFFLGNQKFKDGFDDHVDFYLIFHFIIDDFF